MLTKEVLEAEAPRINFILDKCEAIKGPADVMLATIILLAADDETFEEWSKNGDFEKGLLETEKILNEAGIDTGRQN